LSVYEGPMLSRLSHRQPVSRAVAALALFALAIALSGCAQVGETLSPAFVDPAKYDLYDCKQLEGERKGLTARAAELQGLMAKAETGVAGPVVAEMAYRNDYISIRAQSKLADEAWRRSKCHDTPPAAPAAAAATPPARAPGPGTKGGPSRAGSAVY
jgi:hypothetical protein